jgi:hypothetical protein
MKPPKVLTKLDLIRLRRQAEAPGIFPGMGRARVFRDRKKEARRRACRGKVSY